MRVMITGSEGYIGIGLAHKLKTSGYDVVGIDSMLFRDCLADNGPRLRYNLVIKDIRDLSAADFDGIDAVIHLAGLSNDPMGNLNPELTYDINFRQSYRIAQLAKLMKVKRFIFSSSCSVYGTNPKMVTETFNTNPLTPYANSKEMAEAAISMLADGEFCPVFLRNATVYGWSQMFRTDLAINNLVANAFLTGQIKLNSDGKAIRPFIHVYDLERIFKLMLEADFNIVYNQVFNIGANYSNYRIIDIANIIHNLFPNYSIVFADDATADSRNYNVDFTKFAKYFPDFRFINSVENTILGLHNIFYSYNLSLEDMSKYTRLDKLSELMHNGTIDSNLRWVYS